MNAFATKAGDTLFRSGSHPYSTGSLPFLARAFRALSERSRRRRAMEELNALTDRELADIGLTRGEIGHAVRGEF